MSVFFRPELFFILHFNHIKADSTHSRNTVINACTNISDKNEFVEHVWPTISAFFIYISTHSVETVK